jgi:mannose-6-phosphate isomerase class I
MEVRKKREAKKEKNSAACVAYEYALPTDTLDMARIELGGRYPETGWAVNTVCTSLVYVSRGKGTVTSQGVTHHLAEGDQVLVLPHEPYAFDGMMELLFAATPAWSPMQAKILPA